MRQIAALVVLAAAAGAARADEVVLRNGARFEGQVRESGDSVVVTMDFGSITFRKMDVARIERGASSLAEFDAKYAELKGDDIEGRYRLGLWARSKELAQRARKVFEEILVRNPDHEGARAALGFRKYDGRWMTEDEIRIAQGYIVFRGEWIRRDIADSIQQDEARRFVESARFDEVERLRIRAEEAEAAAARARAEASRACGDPDYPDIVSYRRILYPRFYFRPWPKPACPVKPVRCEDKPRAITRKCEHP
ncbi:MAG TPA: hypothetical protein VK661_02480 [Planctomycetota bacterium]|nr:hypothetical protein [Planctomycetota bacterium]